MATCLALQQAASKPIRSVHWKMLSEDAHLQDEPDVTCYQPAGQRPASWCQVMVQPGCSSCCMSGDTLVLSWACEVFVASGLGALIVHLDPCVSRK